MTGTGDTRAMLQTGPAFLDVSDSLTGRRWVGPTLEESRQAEAMAREASLDLALALTLVRRGVAAEAAATRTAIRMLRIFNGPARRERAARAVWPPAPW